MWRQRQDKGKDKDKETMMKKARLKGNSGVFGNKAGNHMSGCQEWRSVPNPVC